MLNKPRAHSTMKTNVWLKDHVPHCTYFTWLIQTRSRIVKLVELNPIESIKYHRNTLAGQTSTGILPKPDKTILRWWCWSYSSGNHVRGFFMSMKNQSRLPVRPCYSRMDELQIDPTLVYTGEIPIPGCTIFINLLALSQSYKRSTFDLGGGSCRSIANSSSVARSITHGRVLNELPYNCPPFPPSNWTKPPMDCSLCLSLIQFRVISLFLEFVCMGRALNPEALARFTVGWLARAKNVKNWTKTVAANFARDQHFFQEVAKVEDVQN